MLKTSRCFKRMRRGRLWYSITMTFVSFEMHFHGNEFSLVFHLMKFSWIAKNWAPCQRRKYFGPESKSAICLRALCQQFSYITLSTASLWSRHGCTSNVLPEWWLGTETVGGERCNLSLARALMWAKAYADYSRPSLCGWNGLVPLGIHPAETSCWRKICIFCRTIGLDIFLPMYLMACLWKWESIFWIHSINHVPSLSLMTL